VRRVRRVADHRLLAGAAPGDDGKEDQPSKQNGHATPSVPVGLR
jgi:hypothetical protein